MSKRLSTPELLEAQRRAILTRLGLTQARILKGLLAEAEGKTIVDGAEGPLPDTTPAARVAAWKELGKVLGIPGIAPESMRVTARIGANGAPEVTVVVRAPDTDADADD